MAPPTIPIISNAAPIFVNLPKPLMARGQMAGHIIALENPSKAKQVIATVPFANTANTTSTMLRRILMINALR